MCINFPPNYSESESLLAMMDLIGRILSSSIKNLFAEQPDILSFTSETGKTEWNLAHHLASEIQRYIFWLNHDVDVTKRSLGYKRPDIVFHKRGTHSLNFLAVELKCEGGIEGDIKKIQRDWMGERLHYRFGAAIRIVDEDDYEGVVFGRDRRNQQKPFSPTTPYMQPAAGPEFEQAAINQLVTKIFETFRSDDYLKNPSKQAKVKEYENQIDHLVYTVYNFTPEEVEIVEGKK